MKDLHQEHMLSALSVAEKARYIASPNPMVGAVIVKDSQIIGTGFTHTPGSDHAEIDAIKDVYKKFKNEASQKLNNSSIYVTLEPCHMCCMAIVNARIDNLFFGAREPKTGAVVSVDNFFERNFLNHKVSFSGGHMEKESELMLKNFFKDKR